MLNIYEMVGNNPQSHIDYLGLAWKVERSGFGEARAIRDNYSDTFQTLAVSTGLDENEILKWARINRQGEMFANQDELDKAYEVFIPNRLLVMLPEQVRYRWYWKMGTITALYTRVKEYSTYYLRRNMHESAIIYENFGFQLKLYDYTDPCTEIQHEDTMWPVYGIFLAGHGLSGISLLPPSHDASSVGMIEVRKTPLAYIDPLFFRGPAGYHYGTVYVHACFAGGQPWGNLAVPWGDVHVWPSNIPAPATGIKKPRPPEW